MNEQPILTRLATLTAVLALLLACIFVGAAIGLLGAKLLSTPSGMGWDAIADALGGLMVGGVLGLAAGLYLSVGLSNRARWWSSAIAVLLGAGILWSLALTAPGRPSQQPPHTQQNA